MKTRIAVVAFLLTTVLASTASAELSLGMGTRWTWLRLYNPTYLGAVQTAGNGVAYVPNSHSALDAYFLLAFSKKFGVYLQLDYLNTSWSCTAASSGNDPEDDGCTGDESTGDQSFSAFGAEVGIKYFFAEPRRAAISPLMTLGFFKYFASYDDDDSVDDDMIALSDLSSPIGGRLAIGVEYNFSNNFSIGAEIFGLHISSAATSTFETDADDGYPGTVARYSDTSYLTISMYTALTLNFRFYGLFRVYTREEEEQAGQEQREDQRENRQFQQQQQWGEQQGQQGQQWQQPQQQQQQQQWQQPQQQQQQPQQQWQQPQQQQWQQTPPQDPNQQWQQQPQQPAPGTVQ
ncbi:MAG: outer membrane beta-barrel protein [Deltaproteobacteria bacterium]|nr:outer membrane beta-barrel protein [Deltaproteobacteria bacterium]